MGDCEEKPPQFRLGEVAEKINSLVRANTQKPIKGFDEFRELVLSRKYVLDYLRSGDGNRSPTFWVGAGEITFAQFLHGFLEMESAVNALYRDCEVRGEMDHDMPTGLVG